MQNNVIDSSFYNIPRFRKSDCHILFRGIAANCQACGNPAHAVHLPRSKPVRLLCENCCPCATAKSESQTIERKTDMASTDVPVKPPMLQMQISRWRKFDQGTRRGFFSVTLSSGMILNNLVLCQKEDSRWINFPSRPYKIDNETRYEDHIEFTSKETANRFRDQVLAALDAYFKTLPEGKG